ncbi:MULTISPECIES: hypothetical protein [unclassified Pseudonocardia]|nr:MULTISPECIES: hypothetical protein [unclassified Pseudonocardia]
MGEPDEHAGPGPVPAGPDGPGAADAATGRRRTSRRGLLVAGAAAGAGLVVPAFGGRAHAAEPPSPVPPPSSTRVPGPAGMPGPAAGAGALAEAVRAP